MIIASGKKGVITLQCEDCGCVRTVRRNTTLLTKAEHPCRDCSNKRNGKLKIGRPSWNSGRTFEPKKVGSKYINRFGYVLVYCGKSSNGRKDKYMLEHRMVVEQMLGRELDDKELVHHIDGDKTNNSPSNLYVCRDMPHHREIHNRLERVAFDLYKRGIIRFDTELGHYEPAASDSDI